MTVLIDNKPANITPHITRNDDVARGDAIDLVSKALTSIDQLVVVMIFKLAIYKNKKAPHSYCEAHSKHSMIKTVKT